MAGRKRPETLARERAAERIWRRVARRYQQMADPEILPDWLERGLRAWLLRLLKYGLSADQVEHKLIGRVHYRVVLMTEVRAIRVKRSLLRKDFRCHGNYQNCPGCLDCVLEREK